MILNGKPHNADYAIKVSSTGEAFIIRYRKDPKCGPPAILMINVIKAMQIKI